MGAIDPPNKIPLGEKDGDMKKPLRLVLRCPKCKKPHIDQGEWATKVHYTHKCVDTALPQHCEICKVSIDEVAEQPGRIYEARCPEIRGAPHKFVATPPLKGCGFEWRPALVPTVGVEGLGR